MCKKYIPRFELIHCHDEEIWDLHHQCVCPSLNQRHRKPLLSILCANQGDQHPKETPRMAHLLYYVSTGQSHLEIFFQMYHCRGHLKIIILLITCWPDIYYHKFIYITYYNKRGDPAYFVPPNRQFLIIIFLNIYSAIRDTRSA